MRPRLSYFSIIAAVAVLLGMAAMLVSLIPAQASTKSATITVTADVANNCKISVTQPGTITYDPIGTNATTDQHDTSGAVVVNCTKGDSASIDLDKGSNSVAAGSYFTPQMIGTGTNTSKLQYIVFQPGAVPGSSPYTATAAFTTEWGSTDSLDGSTHGSAYAFTGVGPGTNGKITLPLGIDIPQAQNVSADSYTDTMTATVTY